MQALLVSAAPTTLPLLFSSYLTCSFSPPCPFFHHSFTSNLYQMWQELSSYSSCSIRLQWAPDTRFSRGTTPLMSWPDAERYLCPLQSLVVSLLSTFFKLQATVSSKFFDAQFPRFPLRNLRFLLAVFSLVFAATDTAFC